jgi:hypothetical protein
LFLRRVVKVSPGFAVGESRTDNSGLPLDSPVRIAAGDREESEGNQGSAGDAIDEICVRLDRLPLAIELAATRMTTMRPQDVAARLTWRFRLLHNRRRPAPARHRTLRAVVDWSYEMLLPDEQAVFDRLSVFAGPFPLAAAERVVADSTPALVPAAVTDAVGELVERSLVVALGDGRYRLLETLRAYGRERLDDADLQDEVARAHATWVVETAEAAARELFGPHHRAAVRTLDGLFDELRAAHAWALGAEPELAWRLLRALSSHVEDRMPAEAARWARRSLRASRPGLDRAELEPTGLDPAELDPAELDPAEQEPAEFDSAGLDPVELDPARLVPVYAVAAGGARFAGNLAEASRLIDEGLRVCPADDPVIAFLLVVASDIALFEARWDDVHELGERLDSCPPLPDLRVAPLFAEGNRALADAYSGATDSAVARARRVLEDCRHQRNDIGIGFAHYALGEALAERDPAAALTHHEQAHAAAERVDSRFLRGIAMVSIASLQARLGHDELALASFVDVVEHWHRAGNWVQQWTTMRNVADLLVRLHCNVAAVELLTALTVGGRGGPLIGADAERIAAARATVAARITPDEWEQAVDRGAARSDDAAVAAVLDVLRDRALATTAKVPAGRQPR